MFSSRDPSGGNLDHGHFLATARDGSRVLAGCEGAGCITRVWSANPIGTLIVELDGKEVFCGPFADFFTSVRPGFGSPLSGAGPGGGHLAQVPMPFVHSMQMRAEGEGLDALYYQVGVERRDELSSEVTAAELHSLVDTSAPPADARIASLDFDQTATGMPLELSGPGEVVELRLHFQGARPSLDEARRTWIEVQIDAEPRASIQVPLGDLFGLAWDDGSLETLPLHGVDGDRVLRLPMPFARKLTLRNITVADDAPRFTITCAWRPLTAVGDRLPLRASFMRARNQAGRPFAPPVIEGGRGHLVGFLLALAGDSGQGLSFLEGDLTLRVDDEDPPSIRGTGTEDDLDGAWYFRGGPFRGLFHSVATLDEAHGRVVAARFLIPDPVPFVHNLDFGLEHGGGNDTPGSDYAATLFWYGGAPPAMIDASTRVAWLSEQCAAAPIEWQLDTTASQRELARLRHRPAVLSPLGADGTPLRAPTIVEQLGDEDIARASEGATRLRIAPWLPSLRAFHIAGPFAPSRPRDGVHEVFAPERNGTGFDAWRALRTPVGWDGYVDLYREAAPCNGVVMYAACEFDVDQDVDGMLVLGSDDAIAVFLDRRRIHEHVGLRGSGRDQDRVPVHLSQGHHRLVIKVENYDGGFGFHARFEGIAVRELVVPLPDSRKRLDLAGTWRVRLDPERRGLDARWFAAELDGATIALPGTTDRAGLGGPDPELEEVLGVDGTVFIGGARVNYAKHGTGHLVRPHGYIGRAWYQRTFTLPASACGERFTLRLERCLWATRVFVDDVEVGACDSLVAEHRFALPELAPGSHRLTVQVDNSMQVNLGTLGHAYGDETQSRWNGIVGAIELEVRDPVALEHVDVFPAADRRSARVVCVIQNRTAVPASVHLDVALAGAAREAVLDAAPGATRAEVFVGLAEPAAPWDEFTPRLYDAEVRLTAKTADRFARDRRTVTFGFRTFQRDGLRIRVNGRPVFLRGTLDCCVYPRTGHPPMDIDAWLHVLGTIRSYGMNHVRFHSWCPPEAAFVAADRLGVYLQPEAPLWIDGWMTSISPARPVLFGRDPAVVAFIRLEVDRMLQSYGHHPSFCMLTLGNELHLDSDYVELARVIDAARARDPRRLYSISTARRQTASDDYQVTHRTAGGPVRGVGPAHTDWDFATGFAAAGVPVIAHETGQRPVFLDFAELAKYDGPLVPRQLAVLRDQLGQAGLLEQNVAFQRASGAFMLAQYRSEIEGFLRTPDCAGFQLLMLNDFTGQGEALVGVLDPFWDSKGLTTPEEFRRFCAPTVPLLRAPRFVLDGDGALDARAEVAHYGPSDLHGVRATWAVRAAGRELAAGAFDATDVPTGTVTPLGALHLPLAALGVAWPARLDVEVALPDSGATNAWRIWVYPPAGANGVDAAEVVVAEHWDAHTRAALAAGRAVVLTAHGVRGDRAFRNDFLSAYWSAVMFPNTPGTLGLLCDPAHPALAAFPTAAHSDWQWRQVAEGATTFDLTGTAVAPIVQVVPDFHFPRKLADVFELRVGPGRLLVCGCDVTSDLDRRPAARQLRRSLLAYVTSAAFAPTVELPARELDALLGGYRALVDTPPTLGEFAGAALDVEAAGRLEETSLDVPWRPALDDVIRRRDGFGARVTSGGTWRDADGAFWHGAPLVVEVACPVGTAGELVVLFRDSNRLGRRGTVHVAGRGAVLEAHEGAGSWARFPFTADDTADGRVALRAQPTAGPNLMIERLVVAATRR